MVFDKLGPFTPSEETENQLLSNDTLASFQSFHCFLHLPNY